MSSHAGRGKDRNGGNTGGANTGGTNTGGGNTGGTSTGGTSTGGTSTGRPNTGGTSTGRPNTGGPNTGGPNTGGTSTGRPNTGGTNTGGTNTGGPNTGGTSTGRPNTGGTNTGGTNTSGTNTGGTNTGGTSTGGTSTGRPNTGGPNTGGTNTGGPNTGGTSTGGPNTGGTNTGGTNTGGTSTGGTSTGRPNTAGTSTGGTSTGGPNTGGAKRGGGGGRGEVVTARVVARRVLDRVDRGGAWATPALDGELARAGLDERDRRLAAELVYGVLRHRTRIDRALAAHAELKRTPPKVVTALRVAAYQLLFLDRVPGYAAVDDAVGAARAVGGAKLAGFCNAVLRKLAAAGEPALPGEPRARLVAEHSLPGWIAEELVAAAGAERLAELAAAFAEPAPLVARANRRRTTREALIAELTAAGTAARPVEAAAMAIALEGVGDPSRSASFREGRWTVQDAGAQRVAELAAPRAGQRILDACAGVGGKSTHLAELCDDAADIDAADQLATKLELAADTVRRLGATRIRPVVCDLLDPAAPLAAAYDLIVLDAPCSGLGVLRRHPDAKWRLQPADVPRLAELQRRLLDAVVPRLAPGGALVYSVCTFTRAEGPDQVAALVARSGLRLVAEERTWPPACDAFYLARLERPG